MELVDIETLTVGSDEAKSIQECTEDLHLEELSEQQALKDELEGWPLVVGLSGNVQKLVTFGHCVVDASQARLKARIAKPSPEAEFDGLNPVDLDYESLVKLGLVEHLTFCYRNPCWTGSDPKADPAS